MKYFVYMQFFVLIFLLAKSLFANEIAYHEHEGRLQMDTPIDNPISKESFSYFTLDTIIVPGISVGHRHFFNPHLAVDLAFSTGLPIFGINTFLICYPKRHFYLGIGAGISIGSMITHFASNSKWLSYARGLIGYEWRDEKGKIRFVQLKIQTLPVISIGFGF